MIILMRNGLSTKHNPQTTPIGNSRYVGWRLGSYEGEEEGGHLWKECPEKMLIGK
jgi:hypothetical protein